MIGRTPGGRLRDPFWCGPALVLLAAGLVAAQPGSRFVAPAGATDTLALDPDDPAIWINRLDPARSLVVGTVKAAAPHGALAVFDLNGRLRQMHRGLDRPNNVDVEYGLPLGGTLVDIVVATESLGRRLRVFAVASDGTGLADVSGASLGVLAGARGSASLPMGVGLYRRPRDGAVFAIVAPQGGPRDGYLWQYRLADEGTGRVGAAFVRRFGAFSGVGEIEAVVVDDALGYVYYADEDYGIRKAHADPDAPDAGKELAVFGRTGYLGDREGLALYARPDGTGYVVSADQRPRDSVFHVFRREGEPGRPHDHSREVTTFRVGADDTDGIEATSTPLGPGYPAGVLVIMNSLRRNFLLIGDLGGLFPGKNLRGPL